MQTCSQCLMLQDFCCILPILSLYFRSRDLDLRLHREQAARHHQPEQGEAQPEEDAGPPHAGNVPRPGGRAQWQAEA